MNYPVIRGAAYALIHAPNLLLAQGSTQTMERAKHPDSEYLSKLPQHLRSFEAAVNYAPNQAYIGNLLPDELNNIAKPWYDNPIEGSTQGKFGEIMDETLFYALIKISDS
ncbi:MAG: glycine reductase, partial [Eubacteriales bacterium]|nr:glycine reductase [Eubacteriales bacterium]